MDANAEKKTLTRRQMVGAVLVRVSGGMTLSAAIGEVVNFAFLDMDGREVRRKRRTLYRWVAAFQKEGMEGLKPRRAEHTQIGATLGGGFLTHLRACKEKDPRVSIPDIIRIAELKGLVKPGSVSRTTVWRAARAMNLPLMGIQAKESAPEKRRFAFSHRMQMVLCDGKHFRAGITNAKRVVFTFLDDASRKAAVGVVGPTETESLFLRGIHRLLLRYGKCVCLYVDNGAGFIGRDTQVILARLGIHLIHGTEGYPEGRGKIERFNRTQHQGLLRGIPGNPAYDAGLVSLENRIEHYYREVYNENPHEGLGGESPESRWRGDTLALNFVDDREAMERLFVLSKSRKVSPDNVVRAGGGYCEMPLGYAGKTVVIEEDLLHGSYYFMDKGRRICLKTVDLEANAHLHRAGRPVSQEPRTPSITAAEVAFLRDFSPVVSATGDFREPPFPNKE